MTARVRAADDADVIAKRIHILDMQRRGGCCPKWIDGSYPVTECWCYREKPPGQPAINCPQKADGWTKPDGIEAKDYAQ